MKKFAYIDAKTVEEAVKLLTTYGERATVIAGGTDLLTLMRYNILPTSYEVLVNLLAIPGLDKIEEDATGLKIGALARLRSVWKSSIVKEKYGVLAQATRAVASWQIQNMGTIGGNLCQHVRCWYYRSSRNYFFCYRKGGTICYAVAGDNRYHAILGGKVCFAVCPSDTAVALTALSASVKAIGKEGERVIPLDGLYTVLGTTLKPGEILTGVQVPAPKPGTKGAFIKFTYGKGPQFALSSVATVITIAAGAVTDSRIVLGGVAPIPYRATKAEDALKGKTISESVATNAATAAVAEAVPLSMNAYLVNITKALVKRAILA